MLIESTIIICAQDYDLKIQSGQMKGVKKSIDVHNGTTLYMQPAKGGSSECCFGSRKKAVFLVPNEENLMQVLKETSVVTYGIQ